MCSRPLSRCDDGEDCDPDECCAEGEAPRDPSSCGTTECDEFLAGVTDALLVGALGDVSTCTNGYEFYATIPVESWYYIFGGAANQCGFETGLSVNPYESSESCDSGVQFVNGLDGNCPRRCPLHLCT